jgi:hypothetical protein
MTDDILSTSIFALIIAVAIATVTGLVDTEKRLDTAVAAAASAAQAGNATRTAVAGRHHHAPANERASREAS